MACGMAGFLDSRQGDHEPQTGPLQDECLPSPWFADFKDRDTLRVGNWADIIVYNQEKLGFVYDKAVFATDFPGGERRLIQKPTGLRYTNRQLYGHLRRERLHRRATGQAA